VYEDADLMQVYACEEFYRSRTPDEWVAAGERSRSRQMAEHPTVSGLFVRRGGES